MGKTLGKKARKFARKKLPSVLKNRRKFKSRLNSFKKSSSAPSPAVDADAGRLDEKSSVRRNTASDETVNRVARGDFFDMLLGSDDEYATEALSESDGYLSEDSDCPYIRDGADNISDGKDEHLASSLGQNLSIYSELNRLKEKLEMLKKKDPKFSEFLERHNNAIEQLHLDEEFDSDDQLNEEHQDSAVDFGSPKHKLITDSTVDVWCWLLVEEENIVSLSSMLNGYRIACHYWTDGADENLYLRIPNREVFSKILLFVLSEADGIFRKILGISDSCSKDSILKLDRNPKWLTTRPMIKSYLRSTLFLLTQLTNGLIIAHILSRIRASIVFFGAFPFLVPRLIKTLVHLWVTGDDVLSSSSFLVIREMCLQLNSECYEDFLTKSYQAYLGCCNFLEAGNMNRINSLGNSVVELYSLDAQKSYPKVLYYLEQMVAILQQSLKTSQKEEQLRQICSWKFVKSAEIWTEYIRQNIVGNDLQPLIFLTIQIVRGVTYLFTGPRYIPLRFKLIQLLNKLSASGGIFIPIAYLLLDIFDVKGSGRTDTRPEKAISLLSTLKAPKQWLKSRAFQEECVTCSIELLSEHFAQWSYHVSFPDLAAFPMTLLKKFHDNVPTESIRRSVKRFIDQVQANSDFVQRKRDEAAFSPNDEAMTDAFSLEGSRNATFTLYYNTIHEKAVSRGLSLRTS